MAKAQAWITGIAERAKAAGMDKRRPVAVSLMLRRYFHDVS
jgi:hypothetical protein